MCCTQTFDSDGPHNRLCATCRLASHDSGRGRLSSFDLLPTEAEHIVSWAALELCDREKTQTDIYAEFVGKCEALMKEHRGELEFRIPAFSSFNRFSIRQARLSRRLDDTRAIVASLADVPGVVPTGRMVINDRWHTINENENPAWPFYGFAIEDVGGNALIRFRTGEETTADPFLINTYGAYPERPWLPDMIGRGIPYVIVNLFRQPELFPGEPRLRFEVLGIPVYDPRRDSSVGGTGPQRWSDRATWERSDNPKVIEYNIHRGLIIEGYGVWGNPVRAEDLPLDNWFSAMNACDVLVSNGSGGTEKAYVFGFEFSLDTAPSQIIDEINRSCGGETVEVGGVWKTRVGGVGLPVWFMTDGDILVTRPQELDPFPGLDATYNAFSCSFPDPDILWEAREAPPLTNSEWEAEDGLLEYDEALNSWVRRPRRLLRDVSLPGVSNPRQVQRLVSAMALEGRKRISHVLTLGPTALALEPLDAVAWTSARNGYVGKVFDVVLTADPVTTLRPRIGLLEADPNDYTPPAYLPLPAPSTLFPVWTARTVVDFAVEPFSLTDATGAARRPALRLTWDEVAMEPVEGIVWEVRLEATGAVVAQGASHRAADGGVIVAGLLPLTAYQAHARVISDRPTEWTNWLSATTPDLRLSEADMSVAVQEALAEAMAVRDAAFARAAEVLADANAAVAGLRAAAEAAFGDLLGDITDPVIPRLSALDTAMDSRIADIARIDIDRALQVPREIETGNAIDTLSERLASLNLQLSRLRSDVTDAGIYIDPALGRARIEAVARIDGSISEVVVLVDALKSEISLRATYAEVLQVVTEAQLDPASLPVITDLVGRLSEAELVVSGLLGAITAKADTVVLDGVSARVTSAEADIDSLEGQIALRVETATFDALETRVGSAELTLGAIDGPSIGLAVQDARAAALSEDELASLTLQQMMQTIRDRQLAQADIAFARQDLAALVNEDREAIATLRTDLGVAVAGSTALVTAERTARATETGALAQAIDDVSVSVSGLSGAITEINRIEADSASAAARALRQLQLDLGLVNEDLAAQAGVVTALTGRVEDTEDGLEAEVRDSSVMRVAIGEAEDEQASGDLRAILADIDGRGALSRGLADLRTDAWVLIEEGRQAVAGVRQEITVALGSATALIDAERVARTAADQAEAADRLALRADLNTTAAALVTEQLVRAGADEALSQQATDLAARLTVAETGVAANATAAEVLTTRVTEAEGAITAQSEQITSLGSSLSITNTDVAAAQTAAQAAAELAGGKGKVIVQSAAPVTGDRLAQNLWIDTTGGTNTPKRWNGTIWVAVTDKVATDAAAAAATALTQVATKADAEVVEAINTRVTETETGIVALATAQSSLAAQVNDPTTGLAPTRAAVASEAAARADGDTALAGQISTVSAVANSRNRTFLMTSAPPGAVAGDLWINPSASFRLRRWSGTAWADVDDTRIAANAAAITSESVARADGDTALASLITALTATVDGNTAGIANEATARADGDTALAGQISTVSAVANARNRTFRQPTAPGSAVAGDLWIDTANGNRMLRWSGTGWAASDDARLAANAAAVTSESVARADGDAALGARIDTVEATAGDLGAAITTEQAARASGDEALGVQINTVSAVANGRNRTFRQGTAPSGAVVGDLWFNTANGNRAQRWSGTGWVDTDDTRIAANAAAITNESVARATADEALAGQITTISAQATRVRSYRQPTAPGSPQTGDLWFDTGSDNRAKRWSGSAWVDTSDTRIGANAAAITTEATARATADEALATQLVTVSSSVDSLSAQVTTQATTLADVEGRQEASLVFRARAGGAVGEVEVVAADNPGGEPESRIIFRSDLFQFEGDLAQILGDMRVTGNLIVDGDISAESHKFTTPYTGDLDENYVVVHTTDFIEVIVLDEIRTAAGRPVKVSLSCNIDAPDGLVVGFFLFQRRWRPDTASDWSAWNDFRGSDTGPLAGNSTVPNSGLTPFFHMTADMRDAAELRQYRVLMRRQPGAPERRIRLCRIYAGVEQLKR